MKRLIVMRHAKSDWTTAAGSDHARPLNPRGQRAAQALGDWLRREGLQPETVLCSTAQRTQETLAGLALPSSTEVQLHRDLYLAGPDAMLSILRKASGETVLILGHNPGIGAFAEDMLATAPNHPQFARYPTGATLVAEFDIDDWSEAHWANATATQFIIPREL